jgi:hypothetical protein
MTAAVRVQPAQKKGLLCNRIFSQTELTSQQKSKLDPYWDERPRARLRQSSIGACRRGTACPARLREQVRSQPRSRGTRGIQLSRSLDLGASVVILPHRFVGKRTYSGRAANGARGTRSRGLGRKRSFRADNPVGDAVSGHRPAFGCDCLYAARPGARRFGNRFSPHRPRRV